jgi:hypothetical protein
MAVPSLKRLSHSKIRFKRLGTHNSLKIESAAAVSVDEISAQNKSATINGISNPRKPRINCNKKAITNADTMSDMIASALIDRILRRSSLYRIVYADSNNNIGRNT